MIYDLQHLSAKLSQKAAARIIGALVRADGDPIAAEAFVQGQAWHNKNEISMAIKATSTFATVPEAIAQTRPALREFIAAIDEASLLGQIGARPAPANVRLIDNELGGAAVFTAEGEPLPAFGGTLGEQVLKPRPVGLIFVRSREAAKAVGAAAESLLESDIANAVILGTDRQFFSTDETPGRPAGILASTTDLGTITLSVAALDAAIDGALDVCSSAGLVMRSPTWIGSQFALARIAQLRDSGGGKAFPEAAGRRLASFPFAVSAAAHTIGSPAAETVALVDGSEIFVANDEAILFDVSGSASVDLNTTPGRGPGALTSLWQQNLIGIRARRFITWSAAQPIVGGFFRFN